MDTKIHPYDDIESIKPKAYWLTTFNDMITLLMVFFVLLVAMGNPDKARYENIKTAIQNSLGVLYNAKHDDSGVLSDAVTSDTANTIQAPIRDGESEAMKHLEKIEGIEAKKSPKGLELSLQDHLMFDPGSAEITNAGRQVLGDIAAVIKDLNRRIRVEGHTDDRPIATPTYPSNWELSTARAVNVVKYLIDENEIPPALFSAVGYGASKPKVQNTTAAQRAMNRRVEIILESPVPGRDEYETGNQHWRQPR